MASILKVDTLQKPDGSTPTAADLGIDVAGSVVQVQHTTYSIAMSYADTNWNTSNLSITLTPKLNNSKFLLVWTQQAYLDSYGTWTGYRSRVMRNGSAVWTDATGMANAMYTANVMVKETEQYMDTPSTTAPITYEIQYQGLTANANQFNYGNTTSMLTVYEIAQ
jgi:hypothetical protein